MKTPRVSERVEQAHIVRLLRSLGCAVYVLGTVRRKGEYPGTMQTPGIADLEVWVHDQDTTELLKIEVKAKNGRMRPEQVTYREHCQRAGIAHITGGLDEVIAWCVARRMLKPDQVPYYRTDRGPTP